ncbi:putative secreted protein with PEP-CTERM sorting signal [Saccharothrix variisporea]|uniref:Putative secreted protein with PEP-CTERM sorting signal n=1 Tax=Saccharothrix variisporea TaxID=543527 RepID=A0A495XAN6_9PSEU|nr:putative secreted protein with PEP-CTERM sorting signal [Saccharothrix variisporea]
MGQWLELATALLQTAGAGLALGAVVARLRRKKRD